MTKNYANRLSGALVGYINEQLDAGTVEVGRTDALPDRHPMGRELRGEHARVRRDARRAAVRPALYDKRVGEQHDGDARARTVQDVRDRHGQGVRGPPQGTCGQRRLGGGGRRDVLRGPAEPLASRPRPRPFLCHLREPGRDAGNRRAKPHDGVSHLARLLPVPLGCRRRLRRPLVLWGSGTACRRREPRDLRARHCQVRLLRRRPRAGGARRDVARRGDHRRVGVRFCSPFGSTARRWRDEFIRTRVQKSYSCSSRPTQNPLWPAS